MDKISLNKGIYFALITTFVSGLAIFANKFAVSIISPPLIFTTIKNLGVGILIISLLLVFKKWKLLKRLNRKDAFYLLLIGIIGGSIPFYLFFTGLSQIPAINAALIHKTLFIWVAIMAVPLLKERLSALQILGVVLLFSANLVVGGFSGFTFMDGEFLVLIATVLWSVENILAKKILPKIDPDIVTAARMGIGSIILLGASLLTTPASLTQVLTLSSLQWLIMIATMVTLMAYVMTWYRALKYAPATTVSSILVASTLVTNTLSAIFITHTWTVEMGIQALLIVAGVALFIASAMRDKKIDNKLATS